MLITRTVFLRAKCKMFRNFFMFIKFERVWDVSFAISSDKKTFNVWSKLRSLHRFYVLSAHHYIIESKYPFTIDSRANSKINLKWWMNWMCSQRKKDWKYWHVWNLLSILLLYLLYRDNMGHDVSSLYVCWYKKIQLYAHKKGSWLHAIPYECWNNTHIYMQAKTWQWKRFIHTK